MVVVWQRMGEWKGGLLPNMPSARIVHTVSLPAKIRPESTVYEDGFGSARLAKVFCVRRRSNL